MLNNSYGAEFTVFSEDVTYAENWQQGLLLKKGGSNLIAGKIGGSTINLNDYIVNLNYFSAPREINATGNKEYYFRIDPTYNSVTKRSNQAPIELEYQRVGTYRNREVNCFITFQNFYFKINPEQFENSYGESNPLISVSNHFSDGFWYGGYEQQDVIYKFYYSDDTTKTPIKIENTLFTANSLNYNEGVAYLTNNNSKMYTTQLGKDRYLTIKQQGDFQYVFGSQGAISVPGSGWVDRLGDPTFQNCSVSFELVGEYDNAFTYRTIPEPRTMGAIWVAPSTAPLGTPKLPPTKKVDKTTAHIGDTVTYTIKQQLHKVGINILVDHYTSFKMVDELKEGLEYVSSKISIGTEENNDLWNITTGQTVVYELKDPSNLLLNGQVITLTIECKIIKDPNLTDTLIRNKARTEIGDNIFWSTEKKTYIIPEVTNSMDKTGPDVIYDTEERVHYNIDYTATVQGFIGKVEIVIKDTLPFPINTEKAMELRRNIYVNDQVFTLSTNPTLSDDNKLITWRFTIDNINTFKIENPTFHVSIRDIYFTYANMDTSSELVRNDVEGEVILHNIQPTAPPPENYETAKDHWNIRKEFKINVTAKKKWEDFGKGREKRPDALVFVLFANGNPTDNIYQLSTKSKDEEEVTFEGLDKYDAQGNRIRYEVLEITKQQYDQYFTLSMLQGEFVTSDTDLRYYKDDAQKTYEEPYQDGGKLVVYEVKNNYTSISIKGNVWKDTNIDGKKVGEEGFKGIEVQLLYVFSNGGGIAYYYTGYNVRTDENGNYSFDDVPWNGTYKIRFNYNGQLYEATYFKEDLSGSYSNLREYTDTRSRLNNTFTTISASPNNYGEGKRAFGENQKIRNSNGSDYSFNYTVNSTPYTFNDILSIFDNVDARFYEYNTPFWNRFISDMVSNGIDRNTATKIKEYIEDCIIVSDTPATYSANNLGELNPGTDNIIENIGIGLAKRETNDLSIKTDVYKVKQIINGKTEELGYNSKAELYDVEQRANDNLYNGTNSVNRGLRLSDYLYHAEDYGEDANRNLQLFVTYRIKVKNLGSVSAVVNSIDHYYNPEYLESIASIADSSIFRENTFIGDGNFNKIRNVKITEAENDKVAHGYNRIVLTGVNEEDFSSEIPIGVYHERNNSVDDILHPGEEANIYLTFKVKNDATTNRVYINKSINSISEINGYSTIYTPEDGTVIPDRLDGSDRLINKEITEIQNAGVIDNNSDPGNLAAIDLEDVNNTLIYMKSNGGVTFYSMENDTDQIVFKAKVPTDGETDSGRTIGGVVFEDTRNYQDDDLRVSMGNGYIDDDDIGINGVTVQLVELVPELDERGLALIEQRDGRYVIKYKKEQVVGTYVYSRDEEGRLVLGTNPESDYYSGIGKSKVIISGTGEFLVESKDLGYSGEYRFDSVYPGDFYVRFIYGDTVRTTLTNDGENEVNQLLNNTDYKGLNSKSYNGQDFKSTMYQTAIDNAGNRVGVDQSGSYYGIDGYGYENGSKREEKYSTQNFSKVTAVNDYGSMYYYDLYKSNNITLNDVGVRVSDAKDIYDDRSENIQYSENLTNKNGEVLSSYKKLRSDIDGNDDEKIAKQKELIDELMNKTKMRANSGIINLELEADNSLTSSIDLGLVERAKSQVSLSKEVGHLKLALANGQILFDTNKSVNNLSYSSHTQHGIEYDNYKISGEPTINEINGNITAELIQAYIDSELIQGSSLVMDYRLKVHNLSEVDFKDIKYYYTGIEDSPIDNVSKISIRRIADYNSNLAMFATSLQEDDSWKTIDADYLLNNGFVTEKYGEELRTYNTILINDSLSGEIVPEIFRDKDESLVSERSVNLRMQSDAGHRNVTNSLMFNNTSEILLSSNQGLGRKTEFSIPGNQELTDQRLLSNAIAGKSKEDRMIPAEIDADSAQKINILPPTGEREYLKYILATAVALGILVVGLYIIKKISYKDKDKDEEKAE